MAVDGPLLYELMSRQDVDDTEEIVYLTNLRASALRADMTCEDKREYEYQKHTIILWTISPEWSTIPPGRVLAPVSGEINAK